MFARLASRARRRRRWVWMRARSGRAGESEFGFVVSKAKTTWEKSRTWRFSSSREKPQSVPFDFATSRAVNATASGLFVDGAAADYRLKNFGLQEIGRAHV